MLPSFSENLQEELTFFGLTLLVRGSPFQARDDNVKDYRSSCK